mmetsp:Transcript_6688/g.40918  ORF Transcript_6688/g.40918 Transcript_6688/m.40918 type:complete len:224 (-) Transcript_6688:1782-2453(-)
MITFATIQESASASGRKKAWSGHRSSSQQWIRQRSHSAKHARKSKLYYQLEYPIRSTFLSKREYSPAQKISKHVQVVQMYSQASIASIKHPAFMLAPGVIPPSIILLSVSMAPAMIPFLIPGIASIVSLRAPSIVLLTSVRSTTVTPGISSLIVVCCIRSFLLASKSTVLLPHVIVVIPSPLLIPIPIFVWPIPSIPVPPAVVPVILPSTVHSLAFLRLLPWF